MSRDQVHIRDRLLMLAESSAPHKPFNVKRKPVPKQGSKNGPKLSVQDFVRMDPGYTPDIEHLVFPGRKRNPQQVAPINTAPGKTRSRLAEMFALSRHLQQRSADRETKPRNTVINRSVDSVLEPPRKAGTRTTDGSQRWVVEEPVRQNSTRLSPAKEPDMATTRGPNVSVLHLRSASNPWETSPSSAFTSTASSRSYSSARGGNCVPPLTKHQSLGGAGYSSYKYQGFHSGGEVNSTDIFLSGSCSRELSPVRWCDREVDGVYLGRSGWVQVQQRSLDENRRTNYVSTESLQPSRRIGIKLADYHCASEPGKCPEVNRGLEPQRPVYLDLRGRDFERSKTPSPRGVPESFSPPSVTPIISPPPAFQDRNSRGVKTRTFFGKPPFLPRSNAIVDSDVSPPSSPKPAWNPPPSRKPKATASPLAEQVQRGYSRIPQTKSLEDTTASRRSQFVQRYGESSSSSSSSMGFRSLDSYVPRIAMPRLSENTDSSVDVYEDADDEDNNSSSLNLSVVSSIQTGTSLDRPKEKISPSNRSSRPPYRSQARKSPASSDTNKQQNCTSPTSSSSSNEFPARSPSGSVQQIRRSAPVRQYQTQDDPSLRVRRSRSLQLPDRKAPAGFRDPPMQTRVSPQHPDSHRVIVKMGGPGERPKRYNQSKQPDSELDEEMLREAEVVTGFLYGNRSRAAAQALLIHRYNNGREEKLKEPVKQLTNNGYSVYIVGNANKERQKVLQRGSTAPNLNSAKKSFNVAQPEPKNPCNSDTCDFWPHCAHRETLNSQAQSMMRLSQSYPTHQKSVEKTSPETTRPVAEHVNQKRLSRADTEVRPAGSHIPRRPASSVFLSDNSAKHEKRPSPNKSASVDRKGFAVSDRSPIFGNPSSSSSSSDVYVTTSDRTSTKSPKNAKSSGASTPLEESCAKTETVRELVLTRPGSAPGEKDKSSFVDSQQRSMSLPKSFLSASNQQE